MSPRPLRRARALVRLARWLGPWVDAARVPGAVVRERWTIRGESGSVRPLEATIFRGRLEPLGLFVVSPGLHYDGPDDARFDRFCSVVADAGFVVVAPFLPDYLDLRVQVGAADDFETSVRAAIERFPELGAPTIFSISFGSYPALTAAARLGDAVDGVIVFGGYADFSAVARFCVDGRIDDGSEQRTIAFDRSNLPALFVNLARHLVPARDARQLEEAFRTICRQSWGRPERSDRAFLDRLVAAHEAEVPESIRALFRIGCGADPGAHDLVVRALEDGRDDYADFDPRRSSEGLRCPVVIVHGKDDDVIPWTEAVELDRSLSPRTTTRLYLTGLFSHTGHGGIHPILAAREGATLVRLIGVLACGGELRRAFR